MLADIPGILEKFDALHVVTEQIDTSHEYSDHAQQHLLEKCWRMDGELQRWRGSVESDSVDLVKAQMTSDAVVSTTSSSAEFALAA